MKIAIVAAGFTPGEADKLAPRHGHLQAGRHHRHLPEEDGRGHGRPRLRARFRRALLPPDRGLRRIRLSREPCGELRPAGLCLGLAQVPLPGCLLRRAPQCPAARLLRAGADRARCASATASSCCAPDVNASDWDSTLEPLDEPHGTASSTPLAEVSGSARSEFDHDPLMPSPFQGEGEPAAASSSQAASLAIADKPRRSQQMPPPLEKGRMGGDLQEARSAGGATGIQTIFTTHAVRLGLRQIKGFREDDAAALMAARGSGLRFGARPVAAHRPQPRGDRAAGRWRCLPLAGPRPARRAMGGARPAARGANATACRSSMPPPMAISARSPTFPCRPCRSASMWSTTTATCTCR